MTKDSIDDSGCCYNKWPTQTESSEPSPEPMPKRQKSFGYPAKLRDPRWQKKKNGILERDSYRCQMCKSTDRTLSVHHLAYSGEPWDVQDSELITLCCNCHEEVERAVKAVRRLTANAVFLTCIQELVSCFDCWPKLRAAHVVLEIINGSEKESAPLTDLAYKLIDVIACESFYQGVESGKGESKK